MKTEKLFKGIFEAVKKHSPEILIGSAIAGFGAAIIFGIKNASKAEKEVEEKREEAKKNDEEFTKKDEVIILVKNHVPSIILFTVSSIAVVGASVIHNKRNAGLVAMLKVGETAALEYKTIVKEVVGKEKSEEIEKKYNETKSTPDRNGPIIITGDNYWIRDELTGVQWQGNIQQIINAANESNEKIYSENYISIQEFYDELGIDSAPINTLIGWNMTIGLVKPKFDAMIENGKPIVILAYENKPNDRFREW